MRKLLWIVLLGGCSTAPKPWHDNVHGNRLSGICQQAVQRAYQGVGLAYHECFFAAYSRMCDPMQGGEDLTSISNSLSRLLAHGDHSFAVQLAAEPPPVRSGVAWFLKSLDLGNAPETKAVLDATPDFDFELEKSIRRAFP